MPRNGRPLPRTVSFSASTMPVTASSPRRQSANAPTPGSTTRSARAHLVGVARHHDRLVVAGLARRALERLGGRVQIARAVIDDRDGHGRAPGCGNRPMISLDAAGGARITGGDAGAMGRSSTIQPSKKRRSACSISSPTTTPTILKAAARELPAAQARCLDADQQRDQERDPAARALDAEAPQRIGDGADEKQVGDELQPHAMAQHPQRREQKRPEMEAVAHEHEARRVRKRIAIAAAMSRGLVNRVDGHARLSLVARMSEAISGALLIAGSPACRCAHAGYGLAAERPLGRRHFARGARIDRDRRAQRPRQALEAGLGDMVVVRAI